MPDQNANQLVETASSKNHVEGYQHPGEIDGLELHPEPERHCAILVELTPDVEDAENHRLEEEVDVCSQADHGAAYPVEDQEEQVVSRPAVEVG